MQKRKFTSEFKVKLVLEVLREERTLHEIAAANEINPNQLGAWKKEFLAKAPDLFDTPKKEREERKAAAEAQSEKAAMLKTIGQLTMERDFLQAAVQLTNKPGRRL
jgi:transposase-like protein